MRSAHNVLLLGPPEGWKLMLARRLTTILPAMSLAEAMEIMRSLRVPRLPPVSSALQPPCEPFRHIAGARVLSEPLRAGTTPLDQLAAHELSLEVGVINRGRDEAGNTECRLHDEHREQ